MTTTLRLDFDIGASNVEFGERLSFVFELLGLKYAYAGTPVSVSAFRTMPSTHGGWHVEIEVVQDVSPAAVVAVQAILGSDWRRETFNLMRALVVEHAPDFWRDRWNVLYSTKLEGGRSVLNPDDFGSGKPTIKATMFPGKDVVPLTIKDVDQTEFDNGGEAKPKLIVTFNEFPEHAYWPNVTSIRNLCAVLGNNETKWIGKRVPLVRLKQRNPQTGKVQDVLWVAEADDAAWALPTRRADAGRTRGRRAKKTAHKTEK